MVVTGGSQAQGVPQQQDAGSNRAAPGGHSYLYPHSVEGGGGGGMYGGGMQQQQQQQSAYGYGGYNTGGYPQQQSGVQSGVPPTLGRWHAQCWVGTPGCTIPPRSLHKTALLTAAVSIR